jgi:hypothetical protein
VTSVRVFNIVYASILCLRAHGHRHRVKPDFGWLLWHYAPGGFKRFAVGSVCCHIGLCLTYGDADPDRP